MNRLATILPPDQVLVHVDVTSKKRAFEEVGLLFENLHGLSRTLITDSLFARERLGSTGLGHGDALHARSDRGSRFAIAAARQVFETWFGGVDATRASAASYPRMTSRMAMVSSRIPSAFASCSGPPSKPNRSSISPPRWMNWRTRILPRAL